MSTLREFRELQKLRDNGTKGSTSQTSTPQTPTPPKIATVPPTSGGNSSQDSSVAPPGYTLPPHPYTFGTHFQVDICPTCELYTPTEKDRPSNTDLDTETLRARFRCRPCGHFFDIGMALFDPRGTPGVTLYEGQDRFVPPLPPAAKYPCTRCWMTTGVQFERMVVYLKEERRVACAPACPPHRLNFDE